MKFTRSKRRSAIALASTFGVMGAMLTTVAIAPAAQAHDSMSNGTAADIQVSTTNRAA